MPSATVFDTWTVSVEVPVPPEESTTVVELSDAVGPLGETDVPRVIVPVSPLRLDSVTVLVADAPACIISDVGFREILYSGL